MNVSIILSTDELSMYIWYNLLHIEDHKSLAGTAQFSRSYLICFKENKDTCTDKLIHFYAIYTWSVTCYNVFYCHSDNSSSFLQVLKLTYTESISIIRRRKEHSDFLWFHVYSISDQMMLFWDGILIIYMIFITMSMSTW